MRVKLADLKTNLSRYLREIKASGSPLEVCVRDETVAYLSPVLASSSRSEITALTANLEMLGLQVCEWGKKVSSPPEPGKPGDGKTLENSVVSMRNESVW